LTQNIYEMKNSIFMLYFLISDSNSKKKNTGAQTGRTSLSYGWIGENGEQLKLLLAKE